MARYLTPALGVILGVLILGSVGAFLLYVPILPFAAVVIILLGLILMFILGVQTGGRGWRSSESESRVAAGKHSTLETDSSLRVNIQTLKEMLELKLGRTTYWELWRWLWRPCRSIQNRPGVFR